MNSIVNTFIGSGTSPPWLPREVSEARRFAWWAQLLFLLMALIWFIISIWMVAWFALDGGAGRLALGLFGLIAMVICVMAALFEKRTVIDAIDQGRFHDAKNDSVIWIVMGFFGFALPSLLLILAYVKISDSLAATAPPGYMPYQPGAVTAQVPGPGPVYAPPPVPAQPAPVQPGPTQTQQSHQHQTPMVRCKNCNVQYPMFMHTCPNCGAPKE
jgi:hypothetical protein